MSVSNPDSFWAEARYQGRCARCGSGTSKWAAHHVIYRQHLRRMGAPEWDTRGALRVCDDLDGENCHPRHHNRVEGYVLPITVLTDDNVDYAFELMGEGAESYLSRYYAGEDERVSRRMAELASPA